MSSGCERVPENPPIAQARSVKGHEYAFGGPRLNGSIAPVPDLQPSCRVSDLPRVLYPSPRSPLCANRSRWRTIGRTSRRTAMPVIDVQVHPFDRNHPAELYRHKGQLLLRQGYSEAAEELYRKALSIAQEQEAKLWELRAAMS